jgi:ATP-dependent exoDNAse (exonuclease V) beta subunit
VDVGLGELGVLDGARERPHDDLARAAALLLLADAEPDGRLLYTALTRARERAELITAL